MKRTASPPSPSQFICGAGSALERISTHSTLASFLSVHGLVHMRRCSHRLYELYKLALLSTATWTENSLLRLSGKERAHVRCLKLVQWQVDHVLPPRLVSFSFNSKYIYSLPSTLTELRFGDQFSGSLAVGVLPNSLVKLVFGELNNDLSPGVLPAGLKCLKLSDNFDQPLGFIDAEGKEQSVLPASLTKLKLGRYFCCELGKFLPDGLLHLAFDDDSRFFHLLDPLPPRLATLWLGFLYRCLPNQLPSTLTTLRIGCGDEETLKKQKIPVFPLGLTMLDLGVCLHKKILPGELPASLLDFRMSTRVCDLSFNKVWLPPSLTRLAGNGGPISVGMLPTTLTELEFGDEFNTSFGADVLPLGLKSLTFGDDFDKDLLKGMFPSALTRLMFGCSFNRPIPPYVLPPKLLEVCFGYDFNQPIMPGVLPSSLCLLHGGYEFNQDLIGKDIVLSKVTSITGGTKLRVPVDFERYEIDGENNRGEAEVFYWRHVV